MANGSLKPLGYYVHHHGTGHMQRAIAVCTYITRPVIIFSSQPKPTSVPAHVTYVELTSDVVKGYEQPAKSNFHYTPYGPAIFKRNQQLIDAWQQFSIKELYVDVSVEVALLAKLYGLTVGQALMKGIRIDPAHTYGYNAVDYLLAHRAPQFDEPTDYQATTPIYYSGGISRFKKRQPTALGKGMPHHVAVTVSPKHESDMVNNIMQSARHYPDITWHILGQTFQTDLKNIVVHGAAKSPEAIYEQCQVLIGSGGTNTIMEAASMGKPFVCIPEARPFNEQVASAQKLQDLNAAIYLPMFPPAKEWPRLCDTLRQLDLQAFTDLVNDDAAQRAATIIENAGTL